MLHKDYAGKFTIHNKASNPVADFTIVFRIPLKQPSTDCATADIYSDIIREYGVQLVNKAVIIQYPVPYLANEHTVLPSYFGRAVALPNYANLANDVYNVLKDRYVAHDLDNQFLYVMSQLYSFLYFLDSPSDVVYVNPVHISCRNVFMRLKLAVLSAQLDDEHASEEDVDKQLQKCSFDARLEKLVEVMNTCVELLHSHAVLKFAEYKELCDRASITRALLELAVERSAKTLEELLPVLTEIVDKEEQEESVNE